MAVYSYKALTAKGKNVKGVVDADTVRAARQKLKSQGIFPTHIEESRVERGRNLALTSNRTRQPRVRSGQLSVFTRQLSTLVAAGMPLVESLKALGDQLDNPTLKEITSEIRDKVNEGGTLAASLEDYPKVFPKLYVNMVASGEASGSLDTVLERLADLLEQQVALQRKFISALTYPMLMLILCFGVILLLLAYVVPQITSIFEEQGASLPLPTEIVIFLSDIVLGYWYLIFGFLLLSFLLISSYWKSDKGKMNLSELMLRTPVLGNMQLKVATSRFARNLSSMLASGIELLQALAIVRNIVGNVVLKECIDSAITGVREGSGLAEELSKSGRFPRLLIHMTAIGEKTGQLEQMLDRAANSYESEVDAVVSGLTSILEPLLIVFLAFVVGGILASVMLPMLEMTSLAR
jgi:general secretion pathway protein F